MNVVQGASCNEVADEDVPLPGFRFHPTDEELLGFYLRRKVDKKPLRIELIKQVDIYKFDPWDLPTEASTVGGGGDVGESDSYFFCKRGRKYRNSVRPNRVTGTGFWKATGIDKPVYAQSSSPGQGHACIGLKKTLVYYRGAAGKGTKTDWMMHEFRLPTDDSNIVVGFPIPKIVTQEAEVWTICRIFKRNSSLKKYRPDWRQLAANKASIATQISSQTCSMESDSHGNYISFGSSMVEDYCNNQNPSVHVTHMINGRSQWHNNIAEKMSAVAQIPSSMASSSSFSICPENDFFTDANWDELKSVVEFALEPFPM
ncbi:hypothetical protein V6N12_037134 [Hibiscus sabdariffa]|uniref:NAC domain-containing protein n=1 Tax=Hibiscus sabdariffa TaxID=183260 RepID=A0ABR1ZFI2_9ROSI